MSHLISVHYPFKEGELPFGKEFFFSLLATSLSLDVEEKVLVLKELPKLNEIRAISLVEVWIEERVKFVELGKENPNDIKILSDKMVKDWQSLKQVYELPKLLGEKELVQQIEQLLQNVDYLSALKMAKFLMEDDDKNDDETQTKDSMMHERLRRQDEQVGQTKQEVEQKAFSIFSDLGLDEEMDKGFSVHVDIPKLLDVMHQLRETVIGQEDAIFILTPMLYYHKLFATRLIQQYTKTGKQSQVAYTGDDDCLRQQPVLLMGATGTGKTHLVKYATKAFDLNVVTVDCSTLVRTGIVGINLDTVGRMIYESADRDMRIAETSVVVLDEFDKLFLNEGGNLEIAMQLLTVLEGSAPFPVERYHQDKYSDYPMSLSSERMMFIVVGSFGVHQSNMKRRFKGFSHDDSDRTPKNYDYLFLSKCGVPDELLGRIGRVICLKTLSADDYVKILYQSPTSPWNVLQNQLKMVNSTAELSKELVTHLIENNQEAIDKFGARGLYQAFSSMPVVVAVLAYAASADYEHFVIEYYNYATADGKMLWW